MSTVAVRRRRLLATVALVVLIVAVPLGVYAWGRSSGTFQVRRVVISGARPAHARALRVVLRRRFLGANLFTVTAARVRRALAGFPYVDRVAVDRDFPNTLKVRLSEYVPVALLRGAGQWYVVSAEGRVLAAATTVATPATAGGSSPTPGAQTSPSPAAGQNTPSASVSPAGQSSPAASPSTSPSSTSLPAPGANVVLPRGTRRLPVVVSDAPVFVGGMVADNHVRQALVVLAALSGALRRGALGASATDTSIRVTETGGLTVEFGDTGALTAKVLALEAVLGRYRADRVACTFVDVSVPDRPLGAPLLPAPLVQAATPSVTPAITATSTPAITPSGQPTSQP
jgi:hypothetical protein